MQFFRLDGKVAVVTGGGQGIGEAICRRLASAGARVAVIDLDRSKAEIVAGALAGLGLGGDVTSETDLERVFREVEQTLGPPDILVNNAGITGRAAPLWELNRTDLETVLTTNLVGPFLCCQ